MTRTYRMSPEKRALKAERMKALNADPEFKAKLSAASSERMKALNADPEFKAKTAERMKALHADPEFNPLVRLTDRGRRVYNTLRRKGFTFEQAFTEALKERGEAAE